MLDDAPLDDAVGVLLAIPCDDTTPMSCCCWLRAASKYRDAMAEHSWMAINLRQAVVVS